MSILVPDYEGTQAQIFERFAKGLIQVSAQPLIVLAYAERTNDNDI